MIIKIPDKAQRIMDALQVDGFSAHVVGGCVRDSIMGITPHDWDICTDATPDQMQVVFAGWRVILTGIQHGTLVVVVDGEPIEVTSHRAEQGFSDGRRPDSVEFGVGLIADLSRRDLTINAMAFNDQDGIIDPFGGILDIEWGIIKAVGNPMERFQEDFLRMFRVVRFASRFGFVIESQTRQAIVKNAHLSGDIAIERIQSELIQILLSDNKPDLFNEVMENVAPEFFLNWESISKAPSHIGIRLGIALVHLPPMKAKAVLRRMKFENDIISDAVKVVLLSGIVPIDRFSIRRAISKMGEDAFFMVMSANFAMGMDEARWAMDEAMNIKDAGECVSLAQLAVDGKDLIAAGVEPSPVMGEILQKMLDAVVENPSLNNQQVLLDRFV